MRWFKSFPALSSSLSRFGWIISMFAAAICLHTFWFVDGRSHSASDTLYGVFPYWVPTFLLWVWIDGRMSSD
jgi:hypothetical protein